MEPARFRFSIIGLLCLTSLVAVHLAFPSLLIALGATIFVASVLALLMFPALSAERTREPNKARPLSWTKTYLVFLAAVYLLIVAILFFKLNS